MFGRIEIFAIAGLCVAGLWLDHQRLAGDLAGAKAEIKVERAVTERLRVEARAAEIGRIEAESRKERVREVVRTVAIPAASAACAADPAYDATWSRIERMRRASEGDRPDPAAPSDEPPRGTVSRSRADG